MGKINMGKVLIGGLVAGVVLNIFDFILHGVILMEDWTAAMTALNKPALGGSATAVFVGLDFLGGILLVWIYAAIRPRFGPGVNTAIIAGLAGWALAGLLPTLFQVPMGLFPMKLLWLPLAVSLVFVPLATVAGAWAYKE